MNSEAKGLGLTVQGSGFSLGFFFASHLARTSPLSLGFRV